MYSKNHPWTSDLGDEPIPLGGWNYWIYLVDMVEVIFYPKNMINKEIPQRLWEDYVQYRDRMTVLEKSPANEEADIEFHQLADKVFQIEFESNFDYEQLRWRYDESLKKT